MPDSGHFKSLIINNFLRGDIHFNNTRNAWSTKFQETWTSIRVSKNGKLVSWSYSMRGGRPKLDIESLIFRVDKRSETFTRSIIFGTLYAIKNKLIYNLYKLATHEINFPICHPDYTFLNIPTKFWHLINHNTDKLEKPNPSIKHSSIAYFSKWYKIRLIHSKVVIDAWNFK